MDLVLATKRMRGMLSREADLLAHELAKRSGQSVGAAVVEALREQIQRQSLDSGRQQLEDDLNAIGSRCGALPDIDTRSPEEILGYDERGLFR